MNIEVNPNEVTLVIFHGNCPDGMGAAWSAHKKLKNKARYWAAFHGDEPPDCTGQVVALVDFCYKRKVMEKIIAQAKKVVVIDHHISAMEDMKGVQNADLRFEMKNSGAVLSWKFFHDNKPIPVLLRYIEDRDLWNWKIEHSKEFLAGLDSLDATFENYDLAAESPRKMISIGTPIVQFKQKILEEIAEKATPGKLDGIDIMIVNESHREFVSEAGNLIVKKYNKVAALWYLDHEYGSVKVSLRSSDEVGVDVSKICVKFGGGGHKNAAGFSWTGNIEDLFHFE